MVVFKVTKYFVKHANTAQETWVVGHEPSTHTSPLCTLTGGNKADCGRNNATLNSKDRPENGRQSRGSPTVTDVCLDNTNQEWLPTRFAMLIHGQCVGVSLERVTDWSPCPVSLEISSQAKVKLSSSLVGVLDDVHLAARLGCQYPWQGLCRYCPLH